ncbi:MAG: hypothetical protein ACJAV1_002721 [Paraglaciecola sp.]|jgi:hypothetical protein
MSELEHEKEFSGDADPILSSEVGNGSVELQWKKKDGLFATIKTYTADTLETLDSGKGLIYRVLLTGTAVAILY